MKKLIYCILILNVTVGFSQTKLKKAEKLYDTYHYAEAVDFYDAFIKETQTVDLEVYLNAASAHYRLNQMTQAANYFQKAYERNGNNLMEPYISYYFRSLRAIREYEQANNIYKKHLQQTGNQNALKRFQESVREFEEIRNDTADSRYTISNLQINTEYADFGVVSYGNDKVIFSTSRLGNGKELYSWNQQPYLSLFQASKNEYGELSDPEPFSADIKSDFHDATIAFSPDLTTVYFSSSNTNKNRMVLDNTRNNRFKLYKGELSNGKVTNKKELFFNTDNYSTGHPSISKDGKYLFFASDQPGGYGQADIYYCEIYEDGTLSTPVNAGPHINTSGNDFFPHLTNENILYFASDGHVGFGGLDIYESEFSEGKKFSKAKNSGKVINTPYDDFAIFYIDEQNGYFSSNRPSGKGDDDIYYFHKKPLPCDQFINGSVVDRNSKEPLHNATISIKDSIGVTLAIVQTDSLGLFKTKIPCGQTVSVTAEKEGFVSKTKEEIPIGNINEEHTDPVNFELDKLEDLISKDEETGIEKINLETIYFDFNKATITKDSEKVLDKAIEVMEIFPKMIIKIESHTDSRGSDQYNLDLSDRRAKSTRDYLINNGVDESRIISAIGYGESQLLNHCANGVSCSDEEHEENRRSDFVIVER